jgi:TAT (twin-arginine translocation) pathway signal sequence
MAGTVETEGGKSRRDVLKGLGATAAGVVASGVLSAEKAHADHGVINARSEDPNRPAVHAENAGFPGAAAGESVAVLGAGFTAVDGLGGIGVRGVTRAPDGAGVHAGAVGEGSNAPALRVEGDAQFSTARSGVIPAGQDSVFVSQPHLPGNHITVTLRGDPGGVNSGGQLPPFVVWVENVSGFPPPPGGNGFIVHLSRKVRKDTPFTYLLVKLG